MKQEKSSEPVKVVLDTNIIVAAAFYPDHLPGNIFSSVLAGRLIAYATTEMVEELASVFARPEFRYLERRSRILQLYQERVCMVLSVESITVCRDPDDNKFLACALAAGAQILISGDALLLELKEYRGIRIVTPRAFLKEFIL